MTKRIQHLLLDTEEMSENMDTILEVIDEITNDEKRRKLLPYNLKIREVFTENIKFVTDFAKKTGDYSSLSPTDIKVLALAYQIDKEMEREDDLMMEPTMQRTITVTELPNHTSNPENKDTEIKDDANENEEFTKPKQTEAPKQPGNDCSKINIPGAEGAKQGADWCAIKIEDAVHLDVQNVIEDNFTDQKLANIADLIKKMDLRDGYDVDHLKPDKYTDDEDSDSDFPDSDYDTDGEDEDPYYSSEKLAEKKGQIHRVEFEDEAVEEGT